jgi:streptogramin lyase
MGIFGTAGASAYLYWTEYAGGSINRTEASGPEEGLDWVKGSEVLKLAVDADHVYWSSWGESIGRANLEGREVETEWIKTGGGRPLGLAVDGAHIYWAGFDTNSIGRANLAGGEVEAEWIKGVSSPRAVAVDSGHVYWTSAGTETIGRANLAGGEVQPLWIPVQIPESIAVDSGHVYWVNFGTSSIGRADLAGGQVEPEFIDGPTFPRGLAVDANHIYWADEGTESIGRADLAGGQVEPKFRKVSPRSSWIYGLAVGTQTADPTPASLDFGAVSSGGLSAPRSVTFTNHGNQNLVIRDLTLGGADPAQFLVEAGGCAAIVPPGGSCSVGVRFLPQAVGSFGATLTAHTNGESDSVVSLSGTGSSSSSSSAGQGSAGQGSPGPALTAPNTSFKKGPAGRSTNRRPRFVFGSSQAGGTFVCRLDKQKFHPCKATVTLDVRPGHHVMRVKAVGPTGLVDPTAAKRSFVVLAR